MNLEPGIGEIIEGWQSLSHGDGLIRASAVFRDIIEHLTNTEDLYLPTEFTQLAYAIQKHNFEHRIKATLYQLRAQLKKFDEDRPNYPYPSELHEYCRLVFSWLGGLDSDNGQPTFDYKAIPACFASIRPKAANFLVSARIVLMDRGPQGQFAGISEATPDEEILVDLPELLLFNNEDVRDCLGRVIPMPCILNAFDIEISGSTWKPKYFALLPDYLVDVTAIAGGYQGDGFTVWPYFIQKILPRRSSIHMLIGNIVNFVLDRIITEPEVEIKTVYEQIFKMFALDVIVMDDEAVKQLTETVNGHFNNLRRTVAQDFGKLNIERSNCELEPSFISSEYGLQGRLDVLSKGDEVTIIELKSGRPFRANAYGIKSDHYVQTLLYDLLLRSADVSRNPRNFILYSSQEKQALRYAPAIKKIQVDAIMARNQIVILDAYLRSEDLKLIALPFKDLLLNNLETISPFTERDREKIKKVFDTANELDLTYYKLFLSFVMREFYMSKVGSGGLQGRPGLSSVWLNTIVEKENDFGIMKALLVAEVISESGDLFIAFNFSSETDPLANFRKGDVAMIYPYNKGDVSAVKNQIHKCTLIRRNDSSVTVRLRSKQLDTSVFNDHKSWNLEKDVLDSGFNSSFDSLFIFLASPLEKRELILGIRKPPPADTYWPDHTFSNGLLPEQEDIVRRIYRAQDYFLLWGPPGTGKTSVMIRELVKLYFKTTEEDIYLLAYTNKAVDELCKSVKSLSEAISERAVRLGSRFSCDEAHTDMLFDQQIGEMTDRRSLRDFISGKRIIISTLASFWGKRRLIKSIGKGVLIVDEASQILEPSIVGLLPYFSKFILVGDHLQLPAVSTQNEASTRVLHASLQAIGITDLKMSFFERMYRWHLKQGWQENLALLRFQGRMHVDIMNFVNRSFYQGALEPVPGLARLLANAPKDKLILRLSRMILVPSNANPGSSMIKSNLDEAKKAIQIIQNLLDEAKTDLETVGREAIGIITPFRAQIALIRHHLYQKFGSNSERITVDTVERYQGGARDVVIVSMCLNRKSQLTSVVSLSEEGVDRKFNVALTRAREQVIVIGNLAIMRGIPSYDDYVRSAAILELEAGGN